MDPQTASPNALRRVALVCALMVLSIVSISAFLRLSKAGLGCEPWPSCYGQALRALQRGAAVDDSAVYAVSAARLAHRLLASTALVLTLMLAFGHLTAKPLRRAEATLSLALVATALWLAGLGWLTASSRLPAVAVGNLIGGFAMLALSWRLATSQRSPHGSRRTASPWAASGLALLVIQVALGGVVSAGHASLSCADTAACLREVASQGWPWSTLNPWREPVFDAATSVPINPAGALAQVLHRIGALVVAMVVLLAAWRASRQEQRGTAATLLLLLLLQLAVGWWLVAGGVPLLAALLHNLLAALMLAALARLI